MRRLLSGTWGYLVELTSAARRGWDAFFFTPTDPTALGLIRVVVGVLAFPFQAHAWIHQAYKSMTKRPWPRGGASVPLLVPSLGDGSFPGVVPTPRDQRGIR